MSAYNPEKPFTYKRVLLKISGEILMGDKEFGLDPATINTVCSEMASLSKDGLQIAVVVGGGNIFRGAIGEKIGIDRVIGDNMNLSIGMFFILSRCLGL